jgi:hypothetical protein
MRLRQIESPGRSILTARIFYTAHLVLQLDGDDAYSQLFDDGQRKDRLFCNGGILIRRIRVSARLPRRADERNQ